MLDDRGTSITLVIILRMIILVNWKSFVEVKLMHVGKGSNGT